MYYQHYDNIILSEIPKKLCQHIVLSPTEDYFKELYTIFKLLVLESVQATMSPARKTEIVQTISGTPVTSDVAIMYKI